MQLQEGVVFAKLSVIVLDLSCEVLLVGCSSQFYIFVDAQWVECEHYGFTNSNLALESSLNAQNGLPVRIVIAVLELIYELGLT